MYGAFELTIMRRSLVWRHRFSSEPYRVYAVDLDDAVQHAVRIGGASRQPLCKDDIIESWQYKRTFKVDINGLTGQKMAVPLFAAASCGLLPHL